MGIPNLLRFLFKNLVYMCHVILCCVSVSFRVMSCYVVDVVVFAYTSV